MPSDRIDSEETLVREFLVPLTSGFSGALDLRDDCALLTPAPGAELVVTTDALVEGVHFLPGNDAHSIAYKSLAVNVSDLTAKGAKPLAYVMALSLPDAPQREWMAAFVDGLKSAQEAFGCKLAGGDTDRTPGHLSVSITAFGTVPVGRMVRRSTARAGDLIYVSGTIGDAALGLALTRDPSRAGRWGLDVSAQEALVGHHQRPSPPVRLSETLRTFATAAMDVSDGLIKDYHRLCEASGTGGRIEAARVPLSEPAKMAVASGDVGLDDLLTGGEDYQVLASVPAEHAAQFERTAQNAAVPVTRVGEIGEPAGGIRIVNADGGELSVKETGWDHFKT